MSADLKSTFKDAALSQPIVPETVRLLCFERTYARSMLNPRPVATRLISPVAGDPSPSFSGGETAASNVAVILPVADL